MTVRSWRRVIAVGVLLSIVSGVLVGCGSDESTSATQESSGAGQGTWRKLPRGPLSARDLPLVVGLGDTAYVLGGSDFLCHPAADCDGPATRYADGAAVDLSTARWRSIADAPVPIVNAQAEVMGRSIYVLVPGKEHFRPQRLLRYDVDGDTWRDLGKAPGGVDVLTAWGSLLVGSSSTDERRESVDRLFHPSTERWTALPDDPLPASFDRFVVPYRERLLLFGSPISDNAGEQDDYERDDTKLVAAWSAQTHTWARMSDAPQGGYQAWYLGNLVLLNGHYGPMAGGFFDPSTDTWAPAPPGPREAGKMPKNWMGDAAGVIAVNHTTYEYGDGWVLDARGRNLSWLRVRDPDPGTSNEGVGNVGTHLVIAGGQDWFSEAGGSPGRLVGDVWVWTPPAGEF